MRLPPAVAGEEAPAEELPGPGAQPLQADAADVQRDHPRPLGDDPLDPQPVAGAADQRLPDPEHQHGPERRDVEPDPVAARERVADEVAPRRDLVGEGQRDGQVGVEVHEVPRLVAQPPPHDDHRADRHADQQDEPRDGGDDARVGADHAPQLVEDPEPVGQRVPRGDHRGVREQQRQARRAAPAVPAGQAVEPHQPVEHRQAGDEQDLHERERRAHQSAQAAQTGERARRVRELGHPARAPPQPDDDRRVGARQQPQRPHGRGVPGPGHGCDGDGRGGQQGGLGRRHPGHSDGRALVRQCVSGRSRAVTPIGRCAMRAIRGGSRG